MKSGLITFLTFSAILNFSVSALQASDTDNGEKKTQITSSQQASNLLEMDKQILYRISNFLGEHSLSNFAQTSKKAHSLINDFIKIKKESALQLVNCKSLSTNSVSDSNLSLSPPQTNYGNEIYLNITNPSMFNNMTFNPGAEIILPSGAKIFFTRPLLYASLEALMNITAANAAASGAIYTPAPENTTISALGTPNTYTVIFRPSNQTSADDASDDQEDIKDFCE